MLDAVTVIRLSMTLSLSSCLACNDPSEVTPSELLPFTYKARLTLTNSTCLNSRRSNTQERSGTINMGSRKSLAVMDLNLEEGQWRFEGLVCTDQDLRPQSLCLGLRDSKLLSRIPRAQGQSGESMRCVQWISSPASAPYVMGTTSLYPRDLEWRESLGRCCQAQSENPYALYLELDEEMSFSGEVTLKYEIMIESELNAEEPSIAERRGALALCGSLSERNDEIVRDQCIDRFTLSAQTK